MVENPEIVSNKALSIRDQGKTPEKRYGSIPIKTHPTQLHATTEKIALGLSIESSAIDVTALSDKPKNAAITAVANKENSLCESADTHSINPETTNPGVKKRRVNPIIFIVADSNSPSRKNRLENFIARPLTRNESA